MQDRVNNFYNVKVQTIMVDDNGKNKKMSELYCVNAVSVTDAEAITTKYFQTTSSDFKVVSVTETKIIDVLDKDSGDE